MEAGAGFLIPVSPLFPGSSPCVTSVTGGRRKTKKKGNACSGNRSWDQLLEVGEKDDCNISYCKFIHSFSLFPDTLYCSGVGRWYSKLNTPGRVLRTRRILDEKK